MVDWLQDHIPLRLMKLSGMQSRGVQLSPALSRKFFSVLQKRQRGKNKHNIYSGVKEIVRN